MRTSALGTVSRPAPSVPTPIRVETTLLGILRQIISRLPFNVIYVAKYPPHDMPCTTTRKNILVDSPCMMISIFLF